MKARPNNTNRIGVLIVAVLALSACTRVPSAAPTLSPIEGAIPIPTLAPTAAPPAAAAPTLAPSPTLARTPTLALTPTLATSPTPVGVGKVIIVLGPGRDATQPGTATLVGQGNKTQVTLNMAASQPGAAQPAHVHEDVCPGVGAVKYPLSNVVDGKSVTVVNASLSDLLNHGYSIGVHKSTTEPNIYVAYEALVGIPSSNLP